MSLTKVVLNGIEIAIEIEKNYNTKVFDPDPDFDKASPNHTKNIILKPILLKKLTTYGNGIKH